MIDIHKNIVCVSIAILFFLFIFLYNINANHEGFLNNNISYDAKPYEMDLSRTSLSKFDGRWNYSPVPLTPTQLTLESCDWLSYNTLYNLNLTAKDQAWTHYVEYGSKNGFRMDKIEPYTVLNKETNDPILWEKLPFETADVKTKMNHFSISFWLYINEINTVSHQNIFKITDINYGRQGKGFIRVTLVKTSLSVDNYGSTWPPTIKADIPISRAVFCTIVFGGSAAYIFVNGNKTGPIQLQTMDKRIGNTLEIGVASSTNFYAIRDFHIYKTPLRDEAAVALFNTVSASLSNFKDEAYKFFLVPHREAFVPNIKDGSGFLKKWLNFDQIENFTANVPGLPDEIQVQTGLSTTKSFNFYDYPQISLMNRSGNVLKRASLKELGITTEDSLYYQSFERSKKQYINITDTILLSEKGLTFAMWFSYGSENARFPRLIDFGNGPGKDNIILAIVNQTLYFIVYGEGYERAAEFKLKGSAKHFYHIAWTINPVGAEWNIYFNGEREITLQDRKTPTIFKYIADAGTATLYDRMQADAFTTLEGFTCRSAAQPTPSINYANNPPIQDTVRSGWAWGRYRRRRQVPASTNPNSLSEKIQVPIGMDSFVIPDMDARIMKYNTKYVSVARNTIVTLYSGINQEGETKEIKECPEDKSPNQHTEDVSQFPFKSMKIEKTKSIERVERKNQWIGRSQYGKDDFYEGNIGDFRIFGEVLSAEQIKYIYANPKQPNVSLTSTIQ